MGDTITRLPELHFSNLPRLIELRVCYKAEAKRISELERILIDMQNMHLKHSSFPNSIKLVDLESQRMH